MSYETDERIKSFLDTNQISREQMCREILAIDRRFSDVRPRHPRGGPDGGRDIEAIYKNEQKTFGAVGFVNQANDSREQKKKIQNKFEDDVKRALESGEQPEVFVFFTNINFTAGEKEQLIAYAKKKGFNYCDLMDRERIRISLDSPDGFSIRFQFLGLPLSEAEQASFFAKWGDDINSVISTGFQKVEKKLDRILFLQEASDVLLSLVFSFQLDRIYDADEIGHFRAFTTMYLKEPKHKIFEILFGSSDKLYRMGTHAVEDFKLQMPGIKHGISGGQWESYIDIRKDKKSESPRDEQDEPKYKCVGSSSWIGKNTVELISIWYNHDHFIRLLPRLRLCDFDDAMFLPILNASLASKLKAIHVYANGYKIQEINKINFKIDTSTFNPQIPVEFTEDEIRDVWVRIRPKLASAFRISFSDYTPRRLYESPLTSDSLGMRSKSNIKAKKKLT